MTLLSETTEGMHNLFRLSCLASIEGYYFKPRMDRELLQTVLERAHRDDRMPVGRGADAPAARPVRRGREGGIRLPRHLRPRELLRRDHGPRPRHRAAHHGRPAPAREAARPAARRHQRPALHARARREEPRGPALRAVGLDARRPQPLQVRRRRVLPEDRGRDAARCSATTPRRATTRCSSPSGATCGSTRAPTTCRASRCPRARARRAGSSRRSSAGLHVRYPSGIPDDVRQQADYEVGRHHADGVPRLLPRGRRLHQLVEEQRHPGRPRPRVRRRVDGRRTRCASPTSTRCSTASSSSAS